MTVRLMATALLLSLPALASGQAQPSGVTVMATSSSPFRERSPTGRRPRFFRPVRSWRCSRGIR
jgi:hypothetical protein